eukprot:TRINITY_DN6750_c0_g1_i1.p2 TRINITY_DN6750_c0_g1~~TRINITY_DN6750_c0_g1_i1.p2  ORF type:complete len:313 (+),score=29.69 TRINITY_DN6750_c0_g1_i1:83-1021(+)
MLQVLLKQHKSNFATLRQTCTTAFIYQQNRGFLKKLTVGWDQSEVEKDKKSVGSWFKTKLTDLFGGEQSMEKYRDMNIQDFQKFVKMAFKDNNKGWMSLVGSSMTGYFRQKTKEFKRGPSYVNLQGPMKYKAFDEQIAQHRLQQYDTIIKNMTAEDKQDPLGISARPSSLFRLSTIAKCSVQEVKDCIEKYRLVRASVNRILDYQKEGKPLPESAQEFQQMMGDESLAGAIGIMAGDPSKKLDWKEFEGCPLEGKAYNRNTWCPKTRKRWKRCCGGIVGPKHLFIVPDPAKQPVKKVNPENRHAPENKRVII